MWPKRLFKHDERAQIHVLETVIAALLFFGALQVGVKLIPDNQSTTALDTLSITGEDSLRTLYLLHPDIPNASDYENSSLLYFVVTGRTANITDFLNETLDSFVSYTLSYRTQPDGNETVILEMIKTVTEGVTSHFFFFNKGKLYDIRLLLWREPREVL